MPGNSGANPILSGTNLILRGIDAANYLIYPIGDHIDLIRDQIHLIA